MSLSHQYNVSVVFDMKVYQGCGQVFTSMVTRLKHSLVRHKVSTYV